MRKPAAAIALGLACLLHQAFAATIFPTDPADDPAQRPFIAGPDGMIRSNPENKAFCVSQDGSAFSRRGGGTCRAGDLLYIDVAFDSDQAGDLAERLCDWLRERPPESMDVYGVLCYMRSVPKSPREANGPRHP